MNIDVDVSNVTIQTERLILRPFTPNDAEDMFDYAKDEGVGERAGWPHHKDIDESRNICQMFIEGKKNFAIVLKAENKVIGSLGLEEYDENHLPEYSSQKGREIGYAIGKNYWGKGLVPEAVKAVVDYCFNTLNLDFLCIGYFNYNTQSKRVSEKCAFEFVKYKDFKTRMGTVEKGELVMLTRDKFHVNNIRENLLALQDLGYRDFCSKLIPTVDKANIIGIRSPQLKAYGKELAKNKSAVDSFLKSLPHKYMEEYSLHNAMLYYQKDVDMLFSQIDALLPYIDNWATCDGLCSSLKQLKKYPDKTLAYINKCLDSDKTFTVRFGIVMLLSQFLDDAFNEDHIIRLTKIISDEYYINIAIAWYMATALAKQYDTAIIYIKNKAFGKYVHNKSIQKAIESYRLSDDKKAYLKTLRLK